MRGLSFALLVVGVACSAKSSDLPDDADGGVQPSFVGKTDGGTVDAGDSDCAADTQDVYVISQENVLFSFHPPTLEFTQKGVLNCLTNASPTSMAVDRQGFAWVRYDDGNLWKVDTSDLSCAPTPYTAPDDSSDPFYKFGMGFATTASGASTETLFVDDALGAGLASLDLTTFKITSIGAFTGSLAGSKAELTGTGDGKLYGFFVTSPAQVAEISPTDGSILSTNVLANVFGGEAWAFSFYGGDFYIYTDANVSSGSAPAAGNPGSNVTRYRPSDGSIDVVKSNIGFTIVGAGVSTCVPTTETPK